MANLAATGGFIYKAVLGCAATLVLTYCSFALRINLPSAGFLYLLLILVISLQLGFKAATVASIVATLCLDYYFVPPVFSLNISHSEDWIAMLTFESTALIVSRLSTQAKEQTRIAREQYVHRQQLYQLSRGVLLSDPSRPAGSQILELIRDMLQTESAAIFDGLDATRQGAGPQMDELEIRARDAYLMDRDQDNPALGDWTRVLRLGGRPIGSISMRSETLNSELADAVASLAAIAIERARALDRAARAEASRHGEQLRSAVLDSLAHAFKTPLTTIRAASTGLLEFASLQGTEATLVGLIDQESERLSNLANQLLRTARLEQLRFHPAEDLHLPELVEAVLQDLSWQLSENVVRVQISDSALTVRGDRELVAIGITQLVDNAAKYSAPKSAITIAAWRQRMTTVVSVHNWGPVIPHEERERIFERFYRAPGSEHLAAGSGIGLSITRRAAEAHSGRSWVESSTEAGTTFFFSLPNQPEFASWDVDLPLTPKKPGQNL